MKLRSPYNLLQEIYYDGDPTDRTQIWKLFVCNIFLNRTSRVQVDRIREEFFVRWPDAETAGRADLEEMSKLIECLGLRNRRSATIIRMSREFIDREWEHPDELYGLGRYARDSYDIFVRDRKPKVTSKNNFHNIFFIQTFLVLLPKKLRRKQIWDSKTYS